MKLVFVATVALLVALAYSVPIAQVSSNSDVAKMETIAPTKTEQASSTPAETETTKEVKTSEEKEQEVASPEARETKVMEAQEAKKTEDTKEAKKSEEEGVLATDAKETKVKENKEAKKTEDTKEAKKSEEEEEKEVAATENALPVSTPAKIEDTKETEDTKEAKKSEEEEVVTAKTTSTTSTSPKDEDTKKAKEGEKEEHEVAASDTKADATTDSASGKSEDLEQDDTADIREQALSQVMGFISEMAQPMTPEEHNALRDIISTGGDILMQAEKKARELSQLPEVQNLVQTSADTGIFGMKSDGTVDPDAAADQMTDILAKMASPSDPLTTEEKNVLHELIAGFSRAFVPTKETTEALQKDFEKLMTSFTASAAKTEKKDELLGTTNLLSVFSDKQAFDTKLLTQLTEKFLDSMEKQFEMQQ